MSGPPDIEAIKAEAARIVDPVAWKSWGLWRDTGPNFNVSTEAFEGVRDRVAESLSKADQIHALYLTALQASEDENRRLREGLEKFAHTLKCGLARGERVGSEDIDRVLDLVTAPKPKITDEDRAWAKLAIAEAERFERARSLLQGTGGGNIVRSDEAEASPSPAPEHGRGSAESGA